MVVHVFYIHPISIEEHTALGTEGEREWQRMIIVRENDNKSVFKKGKKQKEQWEIEMRENKRERG